MRTLSAADVQWFSVVKPFSSPQFAIKCTTGYSLNALVDFPIGEPIVLGRTGPSQ